MSGGQTPNTRLNEARFRALADAYGSDLSRWPVAEQAAARDWQISHPEAAALILSEAELLDQWLDHAPTAWVPEALAHAVAQQHHSLQTRTLRRAGLTLWGRLSEDLGFTVHQVRARPAPFFAGMGLATAALTGLVIGLLFMPMSGDASGVYDPKRAAAVQTTDLELQDAALTDWLDDSLDDTEYSL